MRTFQSVPGPPPVPARPTIQDIATRPLTSQGISHQNVEMTPFPVPPPPPPIPPRIGQAGPSLSPNSPVGAHGNFHHTLHRPTSQLNLATHSNDSWNSESSLQAQLRAQREEDDRRAAEELRQEKERLRMEQEELHRQALELERKRREEYERQVAAMEKIRREQEELARLKAIALEEEERRLQREKWAEEDRIRREKWEDEERIKRELEREQWRVEEEERRQKLRLEMADERFAAVFSMREEIEAERLKQEAEEKSKAAVRAAEAEIAKAKEEAEHRRQAQILQEQRDAEMARKLENDADEDEPSTAHATASHPTSTVQTPQQVNNDLPDYEQLRRPQQGAILPPVFKQEHEEIRPPHMGRPHANTTAGITSPGSHLLPHNQPFARPPLGLPNGAPPMRHSMALPPEHAQPSPPPLHNPMHNPMQHPGFPNAGTGQGPPYHNHFFPTRELENSPVPSPSGTTPSRPPGPAKLVRQSNSLGGRDPGRPPAHNANNQHQRNGTLPGPLQQHPGHVAGSPSLNMHPPPLGVRPSSANPAFPVPAEASSSQGAGGSNSPMASTPNAGLVVPIANEYPHGNASQQPIEPLSGISKLTYSYVSQCLNYSSVHGFGRPALRDSDLPAGTPVPDSIVLEPEPSPPYFIVAHTWKSLLKFIASQNIAIIEPSPVALAREKHGPPNLRVVLHFAKVGTHVSFYRQFLILSSIIDTTRRLSYRALFCSTVNHAATSRISLA